MAKASPNLSLDAFDVAILKILQRDNTTPQRAIGEAINLSAPAVQRRIRRMEKTGIIEAMPSGSSHRQQRFSSAITSPGRPTLFS